MEILRLLRLVFAALFLMVMGWGALTTWQIQQQLAPHTDQERREQDTGGWG